MNNLQNNHLSKTTVDQSKELEDKILAFKILYKTLYTCQDNIPLFKTNFLEGKGNYTTIELAKQIETYCVQNPTSRTAKAWELSKKHYQNCNVKNVELFNEIYQYMCKNKTHLGTTFFSQFKNVSSLPNEKIENPDPYQDKMVHNIKFWLEINISENKNLAKKEFK